MAEPHDIDGILIQWGDRLFYPGNRVVKTKPQPKLSGLAARQRAAAIRERIEATVAGAAEETVRAFREADRNCKFELTTETLPILPESVSIAAYRMLQEALSNVVKHAAATHCRVTLRITGQSQIALIVEDDGRGFAPAANESNGLGLVGMRERAAAMRGTFDVHSSPGNGTRLTITLPISAP